MKLVYNISIFLLSNLIKLFTPFSDKLKQGVEGRKNQLYKIRECINDDDKVIWMHCASLGEYEQGKPVLELLQNKYPNYKFVLSFFSPSGFEVLKDKTVADLICYIPFDTKNAAERFIHAIHPDLVIFVKYEFWYNHLAVLNQLKVPTVFISVLVNENYHLFNWYGKFISKELKGVSKIFVQNERSKSIFVKNGFSNIYLSGDTRIDSVISNKESGFNNEWIEIILERDKPIIVVGSSWKKDVDLLAELDEGFFQKYFWIIAPHVIDDSQLKYVADQMKHIEFSYYSKSELMPGSNGLIVDALGQLKYLYKYAKIAYIGGGFGKGVHNTLEPAVHGVPVVFGTNYHKFYEAELLVDRAGFFSVSDSSQMEDILKKLDDKQQYETAVSAIDQFFEEHKGATTSIIEYFGTILEKAI